MLKNPRAWRALIARATKANNKEVAAGTGMSPNEYMERFVRDGKQAVTREVDGDDTERTAKAEREIEHQKELTVGTRVRLVNLATEKSSLRGAKKMQARFSEEVFTVASVSKQARRGGGNVSYLYGLKRANGQDKDGRYHREQLQIVPEMKDTWNPGPSKGRAFLTEFGFWEGGRTRKRRLPTSSFKELAGPAWRVPDVPCLAVDSPVVTSLYVPVEAWRQ